MRRAFPAFVLTAALVGPVACVSTLPGEAHESGDGYPKQMVAVVDSAGSPSNLAVDSKYVYWADINRQSVMKVSPQGIETVARTPFRGYYAVAVDAKSVYWTSGSEDFSKRDIVKVDIAGGAPTTIVSGTDDVETFVVRGEAIYWTTGSGNVMKVGIGGGSPTVLASGQYNHIGLAVDANSAYWIRVDGIVKVGISGGEPVLLARMATESYRNLAVDATYVYWIDAPTNTLLKVPIGGGTPELAYAPASEPTAVAVDASGLYWTEESGAVFALDNSKTDARIVGMAEPGDVFGLINLDATGVYWLAGDAIYRAPK